MGLTYDSQVEMYEKKLAEAKRHAELIEKVVALLPNNLPIKKVHPHTYKGDVTIVLEIEHRPEVKPLLEILTSLPLIVYRDGCVSLFPEELLPENPRGKIENVKPAFWWETECQYWDGYKTKTPTFEWFTRLGEFIVKVEVEIKQDPAHYKVTRNRNGAVIKHTLNEHFCYIYKAPFGDIIKFAAGQYNEPGQLVIYNYHDGEKDFMIK